MNIIDIQDGRAKQKIRGILVRQMMLIEKAFAREVKDLLDKIFRGAVTLLNADIISVDVAVDNKTNLLVTIFKKYYKRCGVVFSDRVFSETQKSYLGIVQTKGIEDDFWYEFENWSVNEAVRKVVRIGGINFVTKKMLEKIVTKGIREQLSYQKIAKNILEHGIRVNPSRALRIARTETHTVSCKAMNVAMNQTRLIKEKEWISARDARTRRKKFNHDIIEVVPMENDFEMTGEPLEYPGDIGGSPGNIINCRCVALYRTRLSEGNAPQYVGD